MEHSYSLPVNPRQVSVVSAAAAEEEEEVAASGVSWAAVIGGAFVAAALSLILLALGTGLGLSSISPWSSSGANASKVGAAAIGWIIAAQIMASAMGGYVAGRLRTKWSTIHDDEVYFRDTAHGLLVWAVGTVITAGLLVSVATSMAGSVAQTGAAAAATIGSSAMRGDGADNDPNAYAVDGLFRADHAVPVTDRSDAAIRGEVARIFAHALERGELTAADKTYAASLIASRTGISQADAEGRINQAVTDTKQALDAARKAAAKLSLWIFIALLSGAFFGSLAATIGGRQRDRVQLRAA